MKALRHPGLRGGPLLVAIGIISLPACQLITELDEGRLVPDADYNEREQDASDAPVDAATRVDASVSDASVRDAFASDAAGFDATVADATVADAMLPDACRIDGDCPESSNPCQRWLCEGGRCIASDQPDGLDCIIDRCLVGQTCASGTCTGGHERDCSDLDGECSTGVCDPQSGACVTQHFAKGTVCNTQYCKVYQQCDGNGACGGGVDRACAGAACEKRTCSESENTCVTEERGCEIDGSCILEGSRNPQNDCEVCDPAIDVNDWTARANGTGCNDGLKCTKADACRDGECRGRDSCRRDEYCSPESGDCEEEDDD